MRHDDIEAWKAMQGMPYEPGVDEPCVDKDCKHNSLTGCKKPGKCVHFTRKARKKKLLKKLALITTGQSGH